MQSASREFFDSQRSCFGAGFPVNRHHGIAKLIFSNRMEIVSGKPDDTFPFFGVFGWRGEGHVFDNREDESFHRNRQCFDFNEKPKRKTGFQVNSFQMHRPSLETHNHQAFVYGRLRRYLKGISRLLNTVTPHRILREFHVQGIRRDGFFFIGDFQVQWIGIFWIHYFG